MTKEEKNDKGHDGKQTDDSQEEQLMDEQYEFGLNEDVREEIEEEDKRKEPEDKADEDDEVVDE
jgi:hypothetical protein